ncbi:MAG: DUF4249 domain-containing protein [Saprospiraceae bacterium]
MKSFLKYISLIILLGLGSCVDEIPIQSGQSDNALVVNGILNNLKETQVIYLQQTRGYGKPPSNVVNAKVTLHEDNSKTYEYSEKTQGEYVLDGSLFTAAIGSYYFISINLPNGSKYQSDPEVMQAPINLDSVNWQVIQKLENTGEGFTRSFPAVQLAISTQFPSSDKNIFLKWSTQSSFQFTTLPECNPFRNVYTCYYGYSINTSELMIYSNEDNQQNRLSNFEVGYEALEPDYKFLETHYFSISQQRLTQQAFEYYRRLRLVSSQNGTIFDAIPAAVNGNVHNVSNKNEKVLGYFQVSPVSIIHEKVVTADFDGKYAIITKNGNFCAWLFGVVGSTYEPSCCNCNQLDQPKIEKPSWW